MFSKWRIKVVKKKKSEEFQDEGALTRVASREALHVPASKFTSVIHRLKQA